MNVMVHPDADGARKALGHLGFRPRINTTPKPVFIHEGVALVSVGNGLHASVDIADAPVVAALNWRACKAANTLYVRTNVRDENGRDVILKLHRLLLLLSDQSVVADHINGDGLDNRRANLRVASRFENMQNRRLPSHNSSGFKGVAFCPATGRWRAEIYADGKRYRLGRFNTPELAAAAYDAAARKLHGEFARTNEMLAA